MVQAMGIPLKTENEESAGKTLQKRRSEGGRRGVTGTCQKGKPWRVPRQPSARLTHGLELAIEVWRLRCSVFRGIPMAFFHVYFKELNCHPLIKTKRIRPSRTFRFGLEEKGIDHV